MDGYFNFLLSALLTKQVKRFRYSLFHFLTPTSSITRSSIPQIVHSLTDTQKKIIPDSKELCASGATCEFFLTCWLSGGLLESPCHGLLRGCCQRSASKTGESSGLAIGTLEAPRETPKAQAGLLDTSTSKWYRTLAAYWLLGFLSAVEVWFGFVFMHFMLKRNQKNKEAKSHLYYFSS